MFLLLLVVLFDLTKEIIYCPERVPILFMENLLFNIVSLGILGFIYLLSIRLLSKYHTLF